MTERWTYVRGMARIYTYHERLSLRQAALVPEGAATTADEKKKFKQ